MPVWQRAVMRIELYLYATAYGVSGWFADDSGFAGRDPLFRDEEPHRSAAHPVGKREPFAA